MKTRPGTLFRISLVMLTLGMITTTWAQNSDDAITVVVGRSTLVKAPWPTVRVAMTDPNIANIQILTPTQVLVQGLKAGATDLILWNKDQEHTLQKRLVVTLDLETLKEHLRQLFPAADLKLSSSGDVVTIQGFLRNSQHTEQLHRYLDKIGLKYVDMTSVAGVQQVQLDVRVAEVSRKAIRAMGMNALGSNDNIFWGQRVGSAEGGALNPSISVGPAKYAPVGGSVPFGYPQDGVTAGPLVTLFAGFPHSNLEFFLQALGENQYLRILANPTVVALSGEEAEFLAGGEFPIPVAQSGAGNAITVTYKEFGVRLKFKPIVLGDGGIRLHTFQEVSELTDVGSVTIEGFSIPGVLTRRSEATLELKSGQTFAMAGLLRHTNSAVASKIPGLGQLPILGSLFRSVRYQKEETDLVILVTPHLVEPINEEAKNLPLPGITHRPPNDWELFVEGRTEGREPAKLDPASAAWMKKLGLSDLVGPGAWESYDEGAVDAPATVPTKPAKAAKVDETNKADDLFRWSTK